jgi:hypothetical protein
MLKDVIWFALVVVELSLQHQMTLQKNKLQHWEQHGAIIANMYFISIL